MAIHAPAAGRFVPRAVFTFAPAAFWALRLTRPLRNSSLTACADAGDVSASTAQPSRATTMTSSGVPAGVYYVRIRAKNACGTSPPSSEIIVTLR